MGTSPADDSIVDQLVKENARLTARVAELEKVLASSSSTAPRKERSFDEREQEYDAMLTEMSEKIRRLRVELQEFKGRPNRSTPREEDLVALGDQLENDRRVLQDDEAALEEQTQQMEMNIAGQRAEIARQRLEVESMYADLRVELDQATGGSSLSERLAPLHRRVQEYSSRNGHTTK
jgi:chromosome segregation ATPase